MDRYSTKFIFFTSSLFTIFLAINAQAELSKAACEDGYSTLPQASQSYCCNTFDVCASKSNPPVVVNPPDLKPVQDKFAKFCAATSALAIIRRDMDDVNSQMNRFCHGYETQLQGLRRGYKLYCGDLKRKVSKIKKEENKIKREMRNNDLSDLNGDGNSNDLDLGILSGHFNKAASSFKKADLDGNGVIDLVDLGFFTDFQRCNEVLRNVDRCTLVDPAATPTPVVTSTPLPYDCNLYPGKPGCDNY